MSLINIGVSGLLAHQTAINTTGHNITNANVEGYSRQDVLFETTPPQFRGGGYIGRGVEVETIRRITNEFITQQLWLDTASFNQLDTVASQAAQLDALVANETTGLGDVFNSFFGAMQAAIDSPTSVPARQLVLSEAERLATRFNSLQARLDSLSANVNSQLRALAPQVSQIAQNIASLNDQIIKSRSVSSEDEPNDLLDQREEALRQLSELVSFTTSVQDGDIINVFVGGGQALVLGANANDVVAVDNVFDRSRTELVIGGVNTAQVATGSFSGGKIGGLVEFRDSLLDGVTGRIGVLALGLAQTINDQHRSGVDLNGSIGLDFFSPINTETAMLQRVTYAADNALPDDRLLAVSVDDAAQLSGSDYQFSLSGNGPFTYTLLRLSDGQVVETGVVAGVFPQSVTTEQGFSIDLRAGSFQAGDRFLIRPSRFSAANLGAEITDPASLALGAPIVAGAQLTNTGTGNITQGRVINVGDIELSNLPAFSSSGELSPPLLVRFTSATTYDVLDNSDPLNPQQLSPPLRNQPFTPGTANALLPFDPDARYVTTTGTATTTGQLGVIGTVSNGYLGETITVQGVDPVTGSNVSGSVNLLAGESAAIAASRINTLSGVSATANTDVTLNINDNGNAQPLLVRLNGVDLTDASLGAPPVPVTADFLAGRINQLFAGSGISATSIGGQLQVRSANGDDLAFEQFGVDAGDSVQAVNINGSPVLSTASAGQELVVGGTVDVVLDGNFNLLSSGGIFTNPSPVPMPVYLGYQVDISGVPNVGDEFTIDFNSAGPGDNRNGLALAALQTADILGGGSSSILDFYGQLVAEVGASTSAAQIDSDAAQSLLSQTTARRDSVSGVNLDEEAARLLKFEQGYNASARVIAVARELFDTLLAAF